MHRSPRGWRIDGMAEPDGGPGRLQGNPFLQGERRMSDNPHRTTYVRETERTTSGSGMAFVIGGLAVAVAFILWLVFGGTADDTVAPGDTTNVTVETPATAEPGATADPVADAAPAAPEAVGAAPAAPDAAAPADPAPAGN